MIGLEASVTFHPGHNPHGAILVFRQKLCNSSTTSLTPWVGFLCWRAQATLCQTRCAGQRVFVWAGAEVRLPLLSVPLFWHKGTRRVFGAVSLACEQHFQRNRATDLRKTLYLTKLPPRASDADLCQDQGNPVNKTLRWYDPPHQTTWRS